MGFFIFGLWLDYPGGELYRLNPDVSPNPSNRYGGAKNTCRAETETGPPPLPSPIPPLFLLARIPSGCYPVMYNCTLP